MSIEVRDPDAIIDTLGHGQDPDALAGNHSQRIVRPAGRACGPVEGGGKRHGREDTNCVRSGCDCEHSIATLATACLCATCKLAAYDYVQMLAHPPHMILTLILIWCT